MVNQVADHDLLTPGSGVPVPAMRLSVVLEGRSESRYDEGVGSKKPAVREEAILSRPRDVKRGHDVNKAQSKRKDVIQTLGKYPQVLESQIPQVSANRQ
jgi:hypothetical protein